MKQVVVVGAGPAGMMAAIKSAEKGNKVVLIEKNDKIGKKMFITGKGRCNVTSNKDVEDIIKNIPGNGIFMYSSLYTFTNQDVMNMIESKGVKLKVERGDRVFPESDKSSDIIRCLEKYLHENSVKIMLKSKVQDILVEDNVAKGVLLEDGRKITGDSVIIATGGSSYPLTGSTGDGYDLLKKHGHSITDIKPSLVPLVTKEKFVQDIMGLALKNVEINIKHKGKSIHKDFGEMLFTHFGLSGPIVLSASRKISDILPKEVEFYIDLKPALTESELDKRIIKDFDKYKNKQFKNSLDELLPKKLIPIMIDLSGIDENKQTNSITKEERRNLITLIKSFKLTIVSTRPLAEAIITRGGVKVKEVDPSTMESKLISGLYIAGELLDVDALTGGFNMQVAFSTGYCAGINS
ncbi:MAG: NAD(P)/FAD-dependent oxidoreductase [Clostridium sp.]